MMYTRAQRSDYDSWNTPGWTADDLIPLSKKLENYCNDTPGIDKSMHGYDGPISISDGGFRGKSGEGLIQTVKEMGKEEILDLEQFGPTGGFSVRITSESNSGGRPFQLSLTRHRGGNDTFPRMESVRMQRPRIFYLL